MRNKLRNPAFLAMAAALGLSAMYTDSGARAGNASIRRLTSTKRQRSNWVKPHDGEQERARRARQIANFQLTKSNGLVRTGGN